MLNRNYNFGAEGDNIYREMLEAHEGLTLEQSAAFNARLILILMNQIGDAETLREALSTARLAGNGRS